MAVLHEEIFDGGGSGGGRVHVVAIGCVAAIHCPVVLSAEIHTWSSTVPAAILPIPRCNVFLMAGRRVGCSAWSAISWAVWVLIAAGVRRGSFAGHAHFDAVM